MARQSKHMTLGEWGQHKDGVLFTSDYPYEVSEHEIDEDGNHHEHKVARTGHIAIMRVHHTAFNRDYFIGLQIGHDGDVFLSGTHRDLPVAASLTELLHDVADFVWRGRPTLETLGTGHFAG